MADVVVVPLTVRPGSLALAPVTATARGSRIPGTVVDARGSGAGWGLLARPAGASGGTVIVTSVEARCGPHSTCTLPRTATHYPIMLTPLRLTSMFTARPGTGMGSVSLVVRLVVPAEPGAALSFSVRPG